MRPARRALAILAIVLVLMMVSSTMLGQAVNATLLGTVTDSTGAVVAGAKVKVTEMRTALERTSSTNSSGNYQFVDLPPGQYEVTVEQPGFRKATEKGIDVQVNSDVRVNLTLQPGAAEQVIEVTAQTPIMETDRADVSQKIETKQVTDLPLGTNRNFQSLLNLVPGTTRAHREHSTFFNAQDSLSTEINGQSRLFNNLLIEGVDDNERTGLLQIYIPPAEAIQTVDVTTSDYLAEFGRVGGSVTNVTLKSGTNEIHGSAYEFNRVSALAARDFFNRTAPFPRTTYNYYGGTVGGPIVKNKLFFFGDILRIDDLRGRFNLFSVPIDAYRNGDFSSANVKIYNPASGNPDGTGRTQFISNGQLNVIPACGGGLAPPACLSPLAQAILAKVPHANIPGQLTQNFQNTSRFLRHTTSFDTKLDYNRTENDRLALRFSRVVQNNDEQPVFGAAGGPGQGGFQGTGNQTIHSAALIHTHLFSSTLVSETRLGLSHYHNVALNADTGTNASDAIGIPGVNLNGFTSGLVNIDISGLSNPVVGYSASLPWDRGETNISLGSTWTKTHGNHSIKWGGEVRRLRDDLVQSQTFGPRGQFQFRTGTTSRNGDSKTDPLVNSFAAFLIDAPTTVGRDISVISGAWRETELFVFGQDQWQFTRKLTLTGGLRWELYLPPTPSRAGGYSNYNPANNTLVVSGIGGNPDNLGRETYYHYFAPRFGIAYRLTEKTVVRSGFGISYEPFPNNNYAFNLPVRQNNAFNALNGFGLAQLPNGQPATMAAGFPAPAPTAVPANGIVTPNPKESYFVIDQKFQQPYVEAWNLAVERALPQNFVVNVAYVGNHGVRIPMQYDLNAATTPAVDPTTGNLLASNCSVEPLCQQFGRTASTNFLYRTSTSSYHALQTKLNHRWAHGLLLSSSYTWGKALAFRSDGGSDGGSAFNYLDFHRNYMVTSYNRAHTFVQSAVYELPFGKNKLWLQSGWPSWILGGWQISGVLTFMSGRPLDFSASGTSLAAPGTRQTPIQIAPFNVLGGIDTSPWFDISAFCPVVHTNPPPGCPVSPNGVMGNLPRYAFAGPRLFNLDAGLSKKVPITERVGLEVRAEAFSLTNTPQFDQPNANVSDKNFGLIKGTVGGNRTMQLGAKVTF